MKTDQVSTLLTESALANLITPSRVPFSSLCAFSNYFLRFLPKPIIKVITVLIAVKVTEADFMIKLCDNIA